MVLYHLYILINFFEITTIFLHIIKSKEYPHAEYNIRWPINYPKANNFPPRRARVAQKTVFRKNLTVPIIVAQCRKWTTPYLFTLNRTTIYALPKAYLYTCIPYLNTCNAYLNTLIQLSASYLNTFNPILVHWLGFRLSATYLNTLPTRQPSRIEHYVTRVECYVTRELSVRVEVPSRLESARYSLSYYIGTSTPLPDQLTLLLLTMHTAVTGNALVWLFTTRTGLLAGFTLTSHDFSRQFFPSFFCFGLCQATHSSRRRKGKKCWQIGLEVGGLFEFFDLLNDFRLWFFHPCFWDRLCFFMVISRLLPFFRTIVFWYRETIVNEICYSFSGLFGLCFSGLTSDIWRCARQGYQ